MKSNLSGVFNIHNKVIIITGGAGFLGMQYSQFLGSLDAKIVIWDKKNISQLKTITRNLQTQFGARLMVQHVDITNEAEVIQAKEKVIAVFRTIDVLINNAAANPAVGSREALAQFVAYEKYPLPLWRNELEVGLTGAMICTKIVVPVMMKKKSGAIINIASELSTIAYDHRIYEKDKYKSVAYITVKTGMLGLTRAWAARLGKYNIRVNAFSPGGVQTENHSLSFVKKYAHLNMLGRMAQINEYNGVILFLCSDASSFMTGGNLIVDGGKSAW